MTRADIEPPLRMVEVRRTYGTGAAAVHALRGVSVELRPGTFTGVMGPSGSGKSTLLHCAAGLDRPTSGEVFLAGMGIGALSECRRTALRGDRIGFVFQAYNLMPALTVQDNITLPLRMARRGVDQEWARFLVQRVGLQEHLTRRPAQLSGGQQQRVAIARALLARPELVLADEPTGALDSATAADVLGLLRAIVDEIGQTVLMVTHDPVAAAHCDRVLFLADGLVVDEMTAPTADRVAARMTAFAVAR